MRVRSIVLRLVPMGRYSQVLVLIPFACGIHERVFAFPNSKVSIIIWIGSLAFAFSPEGQSLAIGGSGSNGFTVQLWDVRTAEWIRDLMSPTGTNTISRHLAFSPDGQILTAGLGAGRGVCLWSTQIGSLLQQFTTRELSKNINIDR